MKTTLATLDAVFADVREGLLETVGVECVLSVEDRCSAILHLPENADTELIARAIDLENVEAWLDENKRVHVALSPWFSTKDTDQTVLSPVKVIHVLLGIHACDLPPTKTFKEKIFSSIAEIMKLQKNS